MLRTMCVDLSKNLMAISGCHSVQDEIPFKKKRKRLYNPDNGLFLRNLESIIVSPCKNKTILIDSSNNQYKNSNNCDQIIESVEKQALGESACHIQQQRKKDKLCNNITTPVEENNLIDVINSKTNFGVQKLKTPHKKQKNIRDEVHNFAEKSNAIEISNENDQFTELLWDAQQAKRKNGKSIINKNNEFFFTDESSVKVVNEGNKFGTSFSIVQKAKDNLKNFKNSMVEKSDFTGKNSSVEDDEHQLKTELFSDRQQTKKKHKITKQNKDMEPVFPEKNNNENISIRQFSSETFSDTHKMRKKHKKSNKNKAKDAILTEVQNGVSNEEIHLVDNIFGDIHQGEKKIKKSKKNDKVKKTTHENNVVETASEKNEPVHSFCSVKKIKKKHKKSKKNEDEERTIIDERNIVEIENQSRNLPIEDNQSVHSFFDVNKIKKKQKKSKKNENEKPIVMDECNIAEIGNQLRNILQSVDKFCNIQQGEKKRKKFEKNKDEVEKSTDENIIVKAASEENPSVHLFCGVKKGKHKKPKKNEDEESTIIDERNMVEIENQSRNLPFEGDQSIHSFFDVNKIKKKHKKSKKNQDKALETTDENSIVKIVNEQNPPAHSFCNINKIKKKHKKLKKIEDEESTIVEERDEVEIGHQMRNVLIEENQSVDKFCVQQKKHKKSKKNKDEVQKSTNENNAVEVANKENQSIHSFCGVKKRKHKKSKKNEDEEPTIIDERNIVETENQLRNLPFEDDQSIHSFFDVNKKKNKKSKKNQDKALETTDENSIVKIVNKENPPAHSFCNINKIKKKHKKLKKNEDEESTIVEERDAVEIGNPMRNVLIEENQSVDKFYVQQKKHKKSKKNKDEVQKSTNENNVVEVANKENQSVHSFCGIKNRKHKKFKMNENEESTVMEERDTIEIRNGLNNIPVELNQSLHLFNGVKKKKHKKTNKNDDEHAVMEERNTGKKRSRLNNLPIGESQSVDMICDVKQAKKNKKSKKNKNKQQNITEENSVITIENEQNQCVDTFCKKQQVKKKQKKSENNKIKETLAESRIESPGVNSDFDNSFHDMRQLKKNHKKSKRNKDKDSSSSSNMINLLEKISAMCDIDNPSNKGDQSSNNNDKNFHPIKESLQETESFHLDSYEEEDVDFAISPLHAFEKVHSLTERQKNELLSQGVTIKRGKFTKEEDKILLKNFENFMNSHVTFDVCDMLGIGTTSKNPDVQRFIKATHFYVRLGKGLNKRTLSSIYKRARLLLNPYRNNDKLSQTEVESVKRLRAMKKRWTTIGAILEQPAEKCIQTLRWHGKSISQEKWTPEEEKKLIAAMKKVTGSSDLSCDKVKKISWEKVAKYVPSRNSTQCRMHWAYHLGWKSGDERGKWNKSCHKKLIKILRNDFYVENVSKIDWFKVYEHFKDVSPSPLYVQKKWLYLKSKINDFKEKNYKTILDQLCKLYNVSVNETVAFRAPFSSSVINQRLSACIANIRKSSERR